MRTSRKTIALISATLITLGACGSGGEDGGTFDTELARRIVYEAGYAKKGFEEQLIELSRESCEDDDEQVYMFTLALAADAGDDAVHDIQRFACAERYRKYLKGSAGG